MQPAGTILCFLCNGFVSYKKKDSSKFQKHLNNEHAAYFGIEYLLAGCTMTEAERLSIKVISDRIEPDSESDQNTSVEEDDEEKSNKTDVKLQKENQARSDCSHCPISFMMSSSLEEHLAKKHPNKPKTSNTRSKEILDAIDRKNSNNDGDFFTMNSFKRASDTLKKTNIATITECPMSRSKRGNVKVVEGDSSKKLDASIKEEAEVKRKSLTSTTPVPKKKTVVNVKKEKKGNVSVAEPNQTAGDGKVCPMCSKEFRTSAMMRFHFVDIHQPGEFPCKGCQKMFTSKNKMSSHYSRHCNPNRKKRTTL